MESSFHNKEVKGPFTKGSVSNDKIALNTLFKQQTQNTLCDNQNRPIWV